MKKKPEYYMRSGSLYHNCGDKHDEKTIKWLLEQNDEQLLIDNSLNIIGKDTNNLYGFYNKIKGFVSLEDLDPCIHIVYIEFNELVKYIDRHNKLKNIM